MKDESLDDGSQRKLVVESSRIRPREEIESIENDTYTITKNKDATSSQPSPDSGRLTDEDFKNHLESTLKSYPKVPPAGHNVTEVAPGFAQFGKNLPENPNKSGIGNQKDTWIQRREQAICAVFTVTIFLQLISCIVQDWYRFGSIEENSSIEVANGSEIELRFVLNVSTIQTVWYSVVHTLLGPSHD